MLASPTLTERIDEELQRFSIGITCTYMLVASCFSSRACHVMFPQCVPHPSSHIGTGRERLQHLQAILHSASVGVQVLLFCFPYLYFFVLFCHVLFLLYCALLYCLMHASACISSSEALTSLTSSLQTLIEINSFDQLVTKTYPRLRLFNR